MPIRPYLAGREFAPETIAEMGVAFEEACNALDIDRNNPSRAMVAQIIISLVENRATAVNVRVGIASILLASMVVGIVLATEIVTKIMDWLIPSSR
jgi:hypothetical protein